MVSRFPAFHIQVNQLKERKNALRGRNLFSYQGLNVCIVRSRLVEKKKRNSVLFVVTESKSETKKMKRTFSADLSCHRFWCLAL